MPPAVPAAGKVEVLVEPVTDYLVLTVTPMVVDLASNLTVQSLSPSQVNVLLSGPQPLITEVDGQPGIVTVTVDVAGQEAGLHRIPLEAEVPQGLSVELFPSEIRVRLEVQV